MRDASIPIPHFEAALSPLPLLSLGALKMTDMKMQDTKLTEQVAGHEIAERKGTVLTELTLQCNVQFLKLKRM